MFERVALLTSHRRNVKRIIPSGHTLDRLLRPGRGLGPDTRRFIEGYGSGIGLQLVRLGHGLSWLKGNTLGEVQFVPR
jgi:hypothetical protein